VIFPPTVSPCRHQGFKLSTLSQGKFTDSCSAVRAVIPCQCVRVASVPELPVCRYPHNQLIISRAREQPSEARRGSREGPASDVRFQLAKRAASRVARNPLHSVPETRFTLFLGSPRPGCTCYGTDSDLWCYQLLRMVLLHPNSAFLGHFRYLENRKFPHFRSTCIGHFRSWASFIWSLVALRHQPKNEQPPKNLSTT